MTTYKPFTHRRLSSRTAEISILQTSDMDKEFCRDPLECAGIALTVLNAKIYHAQKLVDLLHNIKCLDQVIRPIRTDCRQPFVEAVQPTPKEMYDTLKPLQEFTKKILTQYPTEVFSHIKISLKVNDATHDFDFVDIIHAVDKALKDECELNEKETARGGQKKNQHAASHLASKLCVFADEIAPTAKKMQKKKFVALCLSFIGVDFPSHENHAHAFNKMFALASGAFALMERNSK